MKKVHHLLLSFLSLAAFELSAQPTNQDCLGAIAICQTFFVEPNAYSGTGNVLDEINPATSCLASGEKNDVWYTFTVQSSGSLCFTIIPNFPTDDYDWAVFDLTSANCSDIFGNPALEVSCNFSPTTGATGPNGLAGVQNEPCLTVAAGEIYVVNVSQFSPSPNGYTIDFSASSASIFEVDVNINTFKNACFGACDGTATVTTSGGISPYTYTWDDPSAQTLGMATGLCAGTYKVSVTDANGCGPDMDTVTIGINPEIITTTTVIDQNCDSVDGSATAVVTGGIAPYSYLWDNAGSSTLANATGLFAGTNLLVVTDSNQCTDSVDIVIGYADSAQAVINVDKPITCKGLCDGELSVVGINGDTIVSRVWSIQDTVPSIDSLCTDTFSVTAYNQDGCPTLLIVLLTEPDALVVNAVVDSNVSSSIICDGTASANPTGGTPTYNYLWSDSSAQTSETAIGLCIGFYNVSVTDANGCISNGTIYVDVDSVIGINKIEVIDQLSIYPNPTTGILTFEGAEGTVMVYDIYGRMVITANTNTLDISQASTGIYFVRVVDEQGSVYTAKVVKE